MVALSRQYDATIVTALRQRIEQAISAQSDKATQRSRAWDQFTGAPTGTEQDGRSQVQSGDVNSMITAVCAQMVISFSADQVVTFNANNADDEQGAKAESRAVNKVLIEDNGGFRKILDGVQNALMYRNGYVKCWWRVDKLNYTVKHDNIEADDLPVLAESEQGKERRLVSYDPTKKTARVEVTESSNRLSVIAVANDRFFIDPDYEEQELDNCTLCGEIHYKTRDELSRMGVEWAIVKALPATQKDTGEESHNTRRGMTGTVDPIVFQGEIVRVYEGYARLTFQEDDDRTYLYKCWIGDRTQASSGWLLDPEPVSRIPYACGTAFPIANRHEGQALSEKLYQVQDGKTELFRQWIDNIQNCSFGRYGAVTGQVEAADLMTPRAGGPVRIKSPTSIVPIPVIDVGPSIKMALEEFDKARLERGGAGLDMIGAQLAIPGDTAHGTERVFSAAELLISYMARNLAESMVRRLFLLGHAELRDGDGGPIQLKVGEQWVTADPTQWQARTHCKVTVAPSFGERMLQASTLLQGIQLYTTGLQALEGEMCSKAGLYKMTCDWLRLNLINDAESYFIDPTSPQAQQAGQQKQQMAQQQAKEQSDLQARILAIPEQIKAQAGQYKTDQETQFDYFKAVIDAMLKSQELEIGGTIDVIGARTEAEALKNANSASAGADGGGTNGKRSKGNGNGAGKPGAKNGGNSRSSKGN